MSRSQENQKKALDKASLRWRYALFITVLLVSGPITHYLGQYRRGHPLDIHYFWSKLSPQGIFGADLYNGSGGSDWKIGKPLTNAWGATGLRSLPELRVFALQLVNRDRTLNNRSPLVEDPLLTKAAQLHAEDMLKRQYFKHVSPEGKTPRDRFVAVGGSSRVGVGENILRGYERGLGLTYGKAEAFQRGWMYSNGHRANLLTHGYSRFGYGFAVGAGGQTYAVQMFAMPDPTN
ncbi:MAG TPA: CAP domain-containing protein [Coleofasciculaceae cyanobacterium]|jgi:uncharacterized protein YkwD